MLKKQSFLILVITMLSIVKTFAQLEQDGPPAPPQSPIDDYTLPLMVVTVFLSAYFFYVSNKKKHNVKKL